MVVFRPDTSFPYLRIAREHGVDYGEVIRFIEEIDVEDHSNRMGRVASMQDWERAACLAWLAEDLRRERVTGGVS